LVTKGLSNLPEKGKMRPSHSKLTPDPKRK